MSNLDDILRLFVSNRKLAGRRAAKLEQTRTGHPDSSRVNISDYIKLQTAAQQEAKQQIKDLILELVDKAESHNVTEVGMGDELRKKVEEL
jgi:hypothetical protein